MTDQEIIDIAKKHMEYSVMYGFIGEPSVDSVVAFARAILAAAPVARQEPSQTAGMTLGDRIAHVGGRTNAAGYIEFGSPMAVNALIQHVLRDLSVPVAAEQGERKPVCYRCQKQGKLIEGPCGFCACWPVNA